MHYSIVQDIFFQKYRAIYFHCVRELSVDCMQQVFPKVRLHQVCVCVSLQKQKRCRIAALSWL
uniref:Uncharacterized protein n=1 Tax=Anguilla anguilla TaxID=7936 RepID=A0A0E9RNK5_ANGAN